MAYALSDVADTLRHDKRPGARCSMTQRTAGILLPAFSATRPGDLGIGDTRAIVEWIDLLADHEVGLLQLLPINEVVSFESPYDALSSVAAGASFRGALNCPLQLCCVRLLPRLRRPRRSR